MRCANARMYAMSRSGTATYRSPSSMEKNPQVSYALRRSRHRITCGEAVALAAAMALVTAAIIWDVDRPGYDP